MNATPLIDVVMCLIMFFLIVGKLSSDNGPMVKLPQTGVGQDEQSASVMIVTVSRAAEDAPKAGFAAYGIVVHADGQDLENSKALESAVRAKMLASDTMSVQIRAEKSLAWGSLEPVLQSAGKGGAKSVRLATERLP